MEREGRQWPARDLAPAPRPPIYQQDNETGLESIKPAARGTEKAEAPARAKTSRWGDDETPAPDIGQRFRRRWSWHGVGGLLVEYGGADHPNRPGNIRRRRRRGHGR